jgi:acetyl-CoA carboxylase carboxyl transferase subunit alpha
MDGKDRQICLFDANLLKIYFEQYLYNSLLYFYFMTRQFLDFEQPVADLYEQLDKIKQAGEKTKVDVSATVREIEEKITATREQLYSNLTSWQRVQLSRHPNRPYTLAYIERICDHFIELHGDRNVKDDKALVGGLGEIDGETVMLIGHQKGVNTKMRQMRNFGMSNPEGYRKALRLMKLAEKFNKPIVTLIDTPGAYPGLEAEERGQAEAIARNLFEMIRLKVPVICFIIGEGASGGALGIGIGDRVYMLENTWYTVISPESCSSILWRSWDYKEQAAEQLKLTSSHMQEFELIDGIIKEPLGGAHSNFDEMALILKNKILESIAELKHIKPEERIRQRIEKFSKMGFYDEE